MRMVLDVRGLFRGQIRGVNVPLVSYDINNFDKPLLAMLTAPAFLLIAIDTLDLSSCAAA